jgi:surface polysaccharide O-acyltransferase-like enzyme
MTTYTFVFSSHISTFALGMMCSAFSENKERIVVLFVGLAYALGTGVYYGLPHGIAVVLAILALLRFSRVTIPRPMSQIVFLLSGASLFIYLLHFTFAGAVKRLVGPHHEGLRVLGALVGGILVWKAWIWALALVASQRRRAWPLGGLARR